ncbi:MAG: hypothetical protein WA869_03975, partial [Alloacidobacterium sp.]
FNVCVIVPRVTAATVADGISAPFASELLALEELQAITLNAAGRDSPTARIREARFRISECTFYEVVAGKQRACRKRTRRAAATISTATDASVLTQEDKKLGENGRGTEKEGVQTGLT